ncbi:MAG: DUF1573 domain-containing protein [Bacteroidota bacterium]|nr:DUF1573 domain-containing protein [Bacteroidota bacterium]
MRLLSFLLIMSIVSIGMISCDGQKGKQEEQISTDVITNPKSAEKDDDMGYLPSIEFNKTEHDFGKVIEGEIVTYSFRFKNTGRSDLIISSVSSSCGCTASEYPRDPVEPGEEGIVRLSFDSSRRKGFQSKTATVLANTQPNRTSLRIKAMVINPEKNNI